MFFAHELHIFELNKVKTKDQTANYCDSLVRYSRRKTIEVKIGNLGVGGTNPIRIQSMTTVDTMDTDASIEQAIRMVNAGCEIVRFTAPSIKDAMNLQVIKDGLLARGCTVPLIADIHFTPNAAEVAARIVEKVRINPGNYSDKKRLIVGEYSSSEYQADLEKIRKKLISLLNVCKEYGTALRIGANQGSLSDRIMNRYGDTPLGMVESALEFIRICEDQNFYNTVLSMKSSNPTVMIQAYRLLVFKLNEEGLKPYPLHLGVTEAGDGEDGRIKSAVGIGALLEDGLGDTIRVSLTEEPEAEIPVCYQILERYNNSGEHETIPNIENYPVNPFEYNRRETHKVNNIGGGQPPVVVAEFSLSEDLAGKPKNGVHQAKLFPFGYRYSVTLDKWNITDLACDYLFLGDRDLDFEMPQSLGLIYNHASWLKNRGNSLSFPLINSKQYIEDIERSDKLNFVLLCFDNLSSELIEKLKFDNTAVLFLDTYHSKGFLEQRRIFVKLMERECHVPVIIRRSYQNLSSDKLLINSAIDMGGLLVDGLGDGIFIAAENCGGYKIANDVAFGILQATRTRISKTEYISCPSCGRTLFNLQETTAKIRVKTAHLKGLKIGIMGCIVNGPGEMADADYGYVGSGHGLITLYRGRDVVKRNVKEDKAVDELIGLIVDDGKWFDTK